MAGTVGLGLRRDFLATFLEQQPSNVDFIEVAPENWIGVGGRLGRQFAQACERYPLFCHGLSLNLGGPAALDLEFVGQLKLFLDQHQVVEYSEHLSACADDGHLYDLMPIPFTEAAAKRIADRISQVQDILQRPIAVENVSYYAAPGAEISEAQFLCEVVQQADCKLLLDVNNIIVNSINHGYEAIGFLEAMPGDRIAYMHVAGHDWEAEDLRVDTHGQPVDESVWGLLRRAYDKFGVFPTLLERDFNIPPWPELMAELDRVAESQREADRVAACA